MTRKVPARRSLLVASCTLAIGCQSRAFNSDVRSTKAAGGASAGPADYDLNGSDFTGSPAFKETIEFRTPTSPVRFVPLTQCELFVWAEADIPNWEVDPAALAQVWKDSQKGGTKYLSKTQMPLAKEPKKKVTYAEAHAQIEAYLRYEDSDKSAEDFVQEAWVQGVINFAQGRQIQPPGGTPSFIGPYEGKNIEKKPGVPFTPQALAECQAYVKTIGSSNRVWGSVQHVIADYLAATAFKKKPSASGADGAAAYEELVTSDLVGSIPFFSAVASLPDPAIGTYDPAKDTRRYVVPTVSFRTMKALAGFLGDNGKAKAAQDLAIKSLCYFAKAGNRLNDYRIENPPPSWNQERKNGGDPDLVTTRWVGNWERKPPHVASTDHPEVAEDLGWNEAMCAKLDDEDYAKPLRPLP
jgi:hypothetical protein